MLDLTSNTDKNNLKSWSNDIQLNKYCNKRENNRNLHFLFEFQAMFSFCQADVLFAKPHSDIRGQNGLTRQLKQHVTSYYFQYMKTVQLQNNFQFGHQQILKAKLQASDIHCCLGCPSNRNVDLYNKYQYLSFIKPLHAFRQCTIRMCRSCSQLPLSRCNIILSDKK